MILCPIFHYRLLHKTAKNQYLDPFESYDSSAFPQAGATGQGANYTDVRIKREGKFRTIRNYLSACAGAYRHPWLFSHSIPRGVRLLHDLLFAYSSLK